jgi:hypothetical protein
MTKTLRELIETNDFTGYQIDSLASKTDSEEIEQAIYGMNGSCTLPYDLVDEFADKFQVESISINTWICTDTEVGLEILRMRNKPVGIIWKSARKIDQTISFLSPDALKSFKTAWESVKSDPASDAIITSDDVLDMPVPAAGQKALHMQSGNEGFPSLTAAGVAEWIDMHGGLTAVSNKAALQYSERALTRDIELQESIIQRTEDYIDDTRIEIEKAIQEELKELQEHRDALVKFRDELRTRISELS